MISRSVTPKAFSIKPGTFHVAGELNRKRAARTAHAVVLVEIRRRVSRMIGTEASVMTLLMMVGWPNSPAIAGSGGLKRTIPRLPSRLSSIAVSSPQMYAPAPTRTSRSKALPLPRDVRRRDSRARRRRRSPRSACAARRDTRSAGRCNPWSRRPRSPRSSSLRSARTDRLP